MKLHLPLAFAACGLLAEEAPAAGLHLAPGQDCSAAYSMTCFHPVPLPQSGAFTGLRVNLGSDLLSMGEMLSAEVFNNLGVLAFSTIFTNAYRRGDGTWVLMNFAPQALPRQGSVRLRMEIGSLDVESVIVSSVGDDFYMQCEAVVVPESRPTLLLSPSLAAMVMQWPASATDFVLETASDLAPPQHWETVTNSVETINGNYSVRVEFEATNRFFRLRRVP